MQDKIQGKVNFSALVATITPQSTQPHRTRLIRTYKQMIKARLRRKKSPAKLRYGNVGTSSIVVISAPVLRSKTKTRTPPPGTSIRATKRPASTSVETTLAPAGSMMRCAADAAFDVVAGRP